MNITSVTRSSLAALLLLVTANSFAESLARAEVIRSEAVGTVTVDGKVEAERQAIIATQTAGRILERLVDAGDRVSKGQLLLRIDDRETRQQETAYVAQLAAAEAQLAQAKLDRDRNAAMLQKKLIGQAAYDQSETIYRAALAEVNAQRASTELSQTQRSFTKVVSPYDGLVAAVSANVGDLAMPGKPVMTVFDPTAFRVFANLSVSVLSRWQREVPMKVNLAHITGVDTAQEVMPTQVVVLPQTDPVAQQVTVRLDLPAGLPNLLPGTFVKVQVPVLSDARLLVPAKAVLRRGEMTAVYVLRDNLAPQLRQIRLGKVLGEQVEVLAGVEAGEQVALDPIAAATVRVNSAEQK